MIKKLIFIVLALQVFSNANASETYDYNIRKTGDWITGCTQGLYKSCTTVALVGDKKLEKPITMYVTRTYFGRTELGFSNFEYRGGGPVIIKIDDKIIYELEFRKDFRSLGKNAQVLIDNKAIVRTLISAIARGQLLRLYRYDGTSYGSTSLNGSYAGLSELDRQQGLRGTTSAFLLKGNKKFTPNESSLETTRTFVPSIRNSDKILTPTDNYIRKNHQDDVFCEEGTTYSRLRKDVIKSSTIAKTILIQIRCGGDALNRLYKIYVGYKTMDAKWVFKIARFIDADDGELKPLPYLPNATIFNFSSATIESKFLRRKQGDCGLRKRYHWNPDTLKQYDDEVIFELRNIYSMPVCGGANKWIQVL